MSGARGKSGRRRGHINWGSKPVLECCLQVVEDAGSAEISPLASCFGISVYCPLHSLSSKGVAKEGTNKVRAMLDGT